MHTIEKTITHINLGATDFTPILSGLGEGGGGYFKWYRVYLKLSLYFVCRRTKLEYKL